MDCARYQLVVVLAGGGVKNEELAIACLGVETMAYVMVRMQGIQRSSDLCQNRRISLVVVV